MFHEASWTGCSVRHRGRTLHEQPGAAQTSLTNTGVDSNATGQATLTDVTSSGFWSYWYSNQGYEVYSGNLTLSCEGLTPGATYRVGPIR